MGLYERLKDLANILGDYYGYWGVREGVTRNIEVAKDIAKNYTKDEIEEARRILMKQLADSM